MKKLFSFALLCTSLLSIFFIASCKPKDLQMNTEYVYSDISFETAKDIKLDDLSPFIPRGTEIKSINDFENLIRNNIDNYSIIRLTENGQERIFVKTNISAVKISESTITITRNGKQSSFNYTRDGDTFSTTDLNETFYFSDGSIRYNLEFNEKFSVVYNYKIK